jgi:hypothetical protein
LRILQPETQEFAKGLETDHKPAVHCQNRATPWR